MCRWSKHNLCTLYCYLTKVLLLCRLTVLAGIKTGKKKLFIRTDTGSFHEIEPVCVLDFYVHEDFQRQGLGKNVFEVGFHVCSSHAVDDACLDHATRSKKAMITISKPL